MAGFAAGMQGPARAMFSVRDSIEMARFDGSAGFSPDRSRFVVITSKGDIGKNETESTIWLFESATVSAFLHSKDAAGSPFPRIVARISAVPKADYSGSYAPVIAQLRWLPDSRTLLFLGENSSGEWQLYRADSSTGGTERLTPDGQDVTGFDASGAGIAYAARTAAAEPESGPAMRVITGQSLMATLAPRQLAQFLRPRQLWIVDAGGGRKLMGSASGKPIQLDNRYPQFLDAVSLSPDGKQLIVPLGYESARDIWRNYTPVMPNFGFHPERPDAMSPLNSFRPMRYCIVDVATGAARSLVDAPMAAMGAYNDKASAVWSADGARVLLTGTYLPLTGGSSPEDAARRKPCAAALVEVASGSTSCVAETRYNNNTREMLIGASFDAEPGKVDLRFQTYRTQLSQQYDYRQGKWEKIGEQVQPQGEDGSSAPAGNGVPFTVRVQQDLNTPPALWAMDAMDERGKMFWNPNPQMEDIDFGAAEVFHWKDRSGYQWTGGLVRPVNYVRGQRYPLVIQTHGFMENEFMTDGFYPTAGAGRALASSGIVLLQVRGNPEHEESSREAADQLLGFEAAIDKLAAEGLIDPQRVGIIGFSRTCFYVESALIHAPDRFAAATIADGVDESYLQFLAFEDGSGRLKSDGEWMYGAKPFGAGLRKWVAGAPGFHLDRVKAPLRIEAITPMGVLEEWEIYESLRQQGKPVDLVLFPEGQHILQTPLDRLGSQQGNVDWFRFWLQGYEYPDAGKAAQYRRWEQLCDMQAARNRQRPLFCARTRH